MNSLKQLEDHLAQLEKLQRVSGKTLDQFAEATFDIASRTKRVTADVHEWELSQEHIASVIHEMNRASRCYNTPPYVFKVLARKARDPELIGKTLDHIVFTEEYLESHESNRYGDTILTRTRKRKDLIREIAEEYVLAAFRAAAGVTAVTTASSMAPVTPLKGGLGTRRPSMRNLLEASKVFASHPEELRGVGDLVKKIFLYFESTEVIEKHLKPFCVKLVTSRLAELFDARYCEAFENTGMKDGFKRAARREGTTGKHYQKGDHQLIQASAMVRALVSSTAATLKTCVLDPLEDAYEVIQLPCEIAIAGFEEIADRLMRTILIEPALYSDPTLMFLASRGTGIGLFAVTQDGSRAFRDVLLGGVDLVEEVWEWKTTAEAMIGDNNNLIEMVDDVANKFVSRVADLFEIYANSKGEVQKDELEKSVGEWSTDWFPAFDCSVHESTTNVLYLLRVLYGQYFGSFKLLLQHGDADADEQESLSVVENYTARCIEATVKDLETVAEVALAIQIKESGDDSSPGSPPSMFKRKRTKMSRCSPPIFLINNLTFLLDHLRKDPAFQARTMNDPNYDPAEVHEAGSETGPVENDSAKGRCSVPQVPLVANIIDQLSASIEWRMDEYRSAWETLFPSINDDPVLASVADMKYDETPLSKTQRYAVKLWYGETDRALKRKIAEGCAHVVLDTPIRSQLISMATEVVREKLEEMLDLLGGKDWSTRPGKWMQRSVADWTSEIEKMF
jgi:hypothetical protein